MNRASAESPLSTLSCRSRRPLSARERSNVPSVSLSASPCAASVTQPAGRVLEEAVIQSTQVGAINSWLRNQPEEIVSTCVASLRDALVPYTEGQSVRLPGGMWLISSAAA
jgi:hypothetical protein